MILNLLSKISFIYIYIYKQGIIQKILSELTFSDNFQHMAVHCNIYQKVKNAVIF